jgi:hypothetical protein
MAGQFQLSRVSRNQLSNLDDPVFRPRPSDDNHFVHGRKPLPWDYFRVARHPLQMANSRRNFLTQAVVRPGASHNYRVELLYQRRTRRARSVFQRLALPTAVSISNGNMFGMKEVERPAPVLVAAAPSRFRRRH